MDNNSLLDIRSDYDEKFGFNVDVKTVHQTKKGFSPDVVKEISSIKNEPEWMTQFRLHALEAFLRKPMPKWGPDLSNINFDNITYYLSASKNKAKSWEDVPQEIKNTFDRLGIPESEKKFLAGVEAQFDSEVVYSKLREDLEKLGVIFCSTDQALKEHPELFKKFFATVVPSEDNKFAALNSAFWSGGSFVYVPKNVHVPIPLQAYFRINSKELGQFERTLIIADEGSRVHYIEGCSAPSYSAGSLHAAVVEVIALEGAHVRYTTLQNWSNNVYNLVTKRAFAHKNAIVEWLDANIGSRITMKFPSVYLIGENAKADMMSIAFAGHGQIQDTGAKAVHMAPNTTSSIVSKSISKGGGRTTYRGLVRVEKGCTNVKSNVRCDALLLDENSISDTIPYMAINEKKVSIGHEASVGKIGEEQLFYLMSRGLSEQEATGLIVRGFFDCFTKQLPLEYAVEFNRLIEMEMEGSVG
ncbi:MAG TPA: Fe-S cluster assembly protein SufB [Candidatus Aenigmarchaeota archaeon]|nr:Fe-S cluster assembly protein SufB [Candidatus Aenigmarchaeota archaeon]